MNADAPPSDELQLLNSCGELRAVYWGLSQLGGLESPHAKSSTHDWPLFRPYSPDPQSREHAARRVLLSTANGEKHDEEAKLSSLAAVRCPEAPRRARVVRSHGSLPVPRGEVAARDVEQTHPQGPLTTHVTARMLCAPSIRRAARLRRALSPERARARQTKHGFGRALRGSRSPLRRRTPPPLYTSA